MTNGTDEHFFFCIEIYRETTMWTVEFAGKFRMQTGAKGGIHTGLYS